jgi:DNA polymerase-1
LDLFPPSVCDSPHIAEQIVSQLVLAPVVAVDTETIRYPKPPLKGKKERPPDLFLDRLRLVQMATPSGTWVFDLKYTPIEVLVPVFISPATKVFHNGQFDLAFIHQATGILPAPVFCTMLADQLLRTEQNIGHRLKDVAPHYVGWDVGKEEQLSDWSSDPLTPKQLSYAARDAAVLIPLHEKLSTEISAKGLEGIMHLEMRLLSAVTEMWEQGITLDWSSWTEVYNQRKADKEAAEAALDEALPKYLAPEQLVDVLTNATKNKIRDKKHQKALDEGAPIKVDWNSDQQTGAILSALGVRLAVTKTGRPSVSIPSLAAARDQHPLVPIFISYNAAQSLMEKHSLAWQEEHVNKVTGLIHASFHQCGTVTGRFSISGPALHNIPREGGYRECFRPLPGYVFLIYDWSQVEVRIIAEVSGDENLIALFRTGEDIYISVAIKLFRLTDRQPTSDERQKAKAVVLGQNYGQSANGLVNYAANACQIDISNREAQKLIDAYFALFPKLRAWQKREESKLLRLGEFDTETPLGRRRTVRAGSYGSAESGKEVLNSPIQGAGADCLKLAMVLLYETRNELPGASVVLPVHDELVYQVPSDQVELGKQRLAWAMDKVLREGALKTVPTGVRPDKIVVSDHWKKI